MGGVRSGGGIPLGEGVGVRGPGSHMHKPRPQYIVATA